MALEVEDDDVKFNEPFNVLEYYEKIMAMIENLKVPLGESVLVEKAYEDFWRILSEFQEMPHLLDEKLFVILNELTDIVMNPKSLEIRAEAFKYLHTVMKVRGYKRAVRYMSNEVSNLEPIMTLLESADSDLNCWHSNYVLLVWLSILVLTPFPMSHFDTPSAVEGKSPTMMFRIESAVKKFLLARDMYNVSSNLAANFYIRLDVKEKKLSSFFDWIISVITGENEVTIHKISVMAAASAILKRGEREDLIEPAKKLLMVVLDKSNDLDNASLLYRKYRAKLIQRIGLTFLKKRKIKWRYEKGSCSLLKNLTIGNVDSTSLSDSDMGSIADVTSLSNVEELSDEEEPFEEETLEYLSEVIDNLIDALEDPDTIVRWSAAKGIGRVTERFTQQMGAMVLTSVLDIFSERKNHSSWHGACLALAQMGSRGLLPKARLAEIVKHVISALTYDEPKRFSSVGDNVRDAACYVFWAFARAFNEEDLRPLSNLIMTHILLVALFDREVHCRRAASAAFQEYVGRCSSLPSNIAVMNEADYLSVGLQNNSYLHLSVQIAKIGGFTKAMIEHLVVDRLCHWDPSIRNLAAKALNNLSSFEPEFTASFLPKLLERAYSKFLTEKLGATPAIAEILHGLYLTGRMCDYVDDATLKNVMNIIPDYRHGHFRGIGGDMIKGSCCKYIWKCSEAKLQNEEVAEDWLSVLQECVYNSDPEVQQMSVTALHSFLKYYSPETITNKIVTEYVDALKATDEDGNFRQACSASVFGNLPNVVFEKHLDTIIPALIKCTEITPATTFFVESRCSALKALVYLITNTDLNKFSKGTVEEVFLCFLRALDDYTMNKRGDIGSHVRYDGVLALSSLTEYVHTHKFTMLEESIIVKIVPKLMQLALEPLDKVRICAGVFLGNLIYSEPEIPYISELGKLKKIFPQDLCKDKDWWKDSVGTYPRFIEVLLLLEPWYMQHIILGFMMTVGGISESSVLKVVTVFCEALEELSLDKAREIAKTMVHILAISYDVDHRSVQVILFFKRLFDSGSMNHVLLHADEPFAKDILLLMKTAQKKLRDYNRLKIIISILCSVSTVKSHVGHEAFNILLKYLKLNSVAVRVVTANSMFETLSLLDDDVFPGCNIQTVMKLLSETRWRGTRDEYIDAVTKISEEIAKVKYL